jgi:hypothetical protein
MPKGLYELCGELGLFICDMTIDETAKSPNDIGRILSERALDSLSITVRQRCERRRIQRIQPIFGSLKVYTIHLQEDGGKVHTFTAERLRDAG